MKNAPVEAAINLKGVVESNKKLTYLRKQSLVSFLK
tara:strand:- start:474 stop:581 length:108 start_codon:yes stop_codon:yes gene_type:complete